MINPGILEYFKLTGVPVSFLCLEVCEIKFYLLNDNLRFNQE